MKKLIGCFVLSAAASAGFAAPQTITLSVPGMYCATCPITVKKALTRVDGVTKTDVNFDKRVAVVSFDDKKTSTQQLIKATTDAGYPATVKQ